MTKLVNAKLCYLFFVLDSLLNKSPKGLSWNYTIAYRELYPTGKYYHKYLCERHPRSTSFPGTGCWVPLTIAHWMVFMNMYSEVIFRSEVHCAHILITSISQGRWRRWCSRWCHRWGWRRCACGRKSFFLFRKNILLPLHMSWWHQKSIWRLRAPLLFRSWRVLLFLGIELFSSPGISPKRWGTGLLLGPWSLAPGFDFVKRGDWPMEEILPVVWSQSIVIISMLKKP